MSFSSPSFSFLFFSFSCPMQCILMRASADIVKIYFFLRKPSSGFSPLSEEGCSNDSQNPYQCLFLPLCILLSFLSPPISFSGLFIFFQPSNILVSGPLPRTLISQIFTSFPLSFCLPLSKRIPDKLIQHHLSPYIPGPPILLHLSPQQLSNIPYAILIYNPILFFIYFLSSFSHPTPPICATRMQLHNDMHFVYCVDCYFLNVYRITYSPS